MVTDEPNTHEFIVNNYGTDFLFKVQLRLGFRVNQRVNTYLYQIVADLVNSGQLAPQEHRYSIYREHSNVGDFRFCLIRKVLTPETEISGFNRRVMELKYMIRHVCGSPARWYGLENSSIIFEYVPLFARTKRQHKLTRISAGNTAAVVAPGNSGAMKRVDVPMQEPEDDDIFADKMKSDTEANAEEVESSVIGGDTASFRPLRVDEEETDEEDAPGENN
jgi:KUP system potassium uptake protein